jgi:hypothetical protein
VNLTNRRGTRARNATALTLSGLVVLLVAGVTGAQGSTQLYRNYSVSNLQYDSQGSANGGVHSAACVPNKTESWNGQVQGQVNFPDPDPGDPVPLNVGSGRFVFDKSAVGTPQAPRFAGYFRIENAPTDYTSNSGDDLATGCRPAPSVRHAVCGNVLRHPTLDVVGRIRFPEVRNPDKLTVEWHFYFSNAPTMFAVAPKIKCGGREMFFPTENGPQKCVERYAFDKFTRARGVQSVLKIDSTKCFYQESGAPGTDHYQGFGFAHGYVYFTRGAAA